MVADTLTRVFFLMGTLLEITLVGPDSARLSDLARNLYEEARQVVDEVSPLYFRSLEGGLVVSGLVDTLLEKSVIIRKKTGGVVDPFYRTPECKVTREAPRRWTFRGGCRWDPSAFLKGYIVDRLFSRIPPDLPAVYLSFGGSSIRVRGAWDVDVEGPDPLVYVEHHTVVVPGRRRVRLYNEAMGVSASHRREEDQPHLYGEGRPLEGAVTVVVVDSTAEEADVEATHRAILELLSRERASPAR